MRWVTTIMLSQSGQGCRATANTGAQPVTMVEVLRTLQQACSTLHLYKQQRHLAEAVAPSCSATSVNDAEPLRHTVVQPAPLGRVNHTCRPCCTPPKQAASALLLPICSREQMELQASRLPMSYAMWCASMLSKYRDSQCLPAAHPLFAHADCQYSFAAHLPLITDLQQDRVKPSYESIAGQSVLELQVFMQSTLLMPCSSAHLPPELL